MINTQMPPIVGYLYTENKACRYSVTCVPWEQRLMVLHLVL